MLGAIFLSLPWRHERQVSSPRQRVERFSFSALASDFDAARAANPALTRWTVAAALADAYVGGSDSAAIGGDLAYQYGHVGSLTGIGASAADTVLSASSFGVAAQSLQPQSVLFGGPRGLR